ncbi:MAG: hypothetical protein U0K18_03115, partial [Acutalibacteraceae bacterium]|nr:hypothetical protein [Acutalibacteraceae bacterium]
NGKPYLLSIFLSVWIPFYTKISEVPRKPNMLYNLFTEKLLGLQAVKTTNVEKEENNIIKSVHKP